MNKLISRSVAKSQGLRYYFTGKPCPKGHISFKYVSNYACKECCKPDKKYQAKYRASLKGQYVRHKHHAKDRGVEFKLSFEEWLSIWETSGKLDERGNRGGKYVMSRYKDRGAYEVGNVFIQPFSDNISEGNITRHEK